MTTALYSLCAAGAWVAAGYKLSATRKLRDPTVAAVCVTLALMGMVFTASIPPLRVWLDHQLTSVNLGVLLTLLCVVAFSTSAQVMLLLWTNTPENARGAVRNRLIALAGVVVLITVLYLGAHPGPHDHSFSRSSAGSLGYAACLLIYLAALGIAMLAIARLGWRYARLTGRPLVAHGLRLAAAGATLVLAYCVYRLGTLVGSWLGSDMARLETLSRFIAGNGALLIMLGLTLPSWGPLFVHGFDHLRRYARYQRLHPLWLSIVAERHPELVLDRSTARALRRFAPGELDFRVYRRIIELFDARLALRPYIDPAARERARRLTRHLDEHERSAIVAATELRSAVRAERAGAPADHEPPEAEEAPLDGDVVSALAWWVRVARAYARSGWVAEALAASTDAPADAATPDSPRRPE
ncbi:hypothetical protein H0B56_11155 [Haloechinothrix sp. YIM 98757]|uniref:DUF6545 domain-containing protein n=1 Tax=Haloechinothrix aidingensis TaxID=2752311 RepID=A0A838A9B3_9PSEU|nr:MAB_1171c family putative transporter [Haloechinothrix aidingensis]MBA0126098.1 hypothetical protein [Haloechinothrix aidingensis]